MNQNQESAKVTSDRNTTTESGRRKRDPYISYPWDKLQHIGDSFIVRAPRSADDRQRILNKVEISASAQAQKSGGQRQYVAKSTRGGIQVWRVR